MSVSLLNNPQVIAAITDGILSNMGNLEAGSGIQISGTTTKTIATNLNQGTGIALATQPNGSITITSTGGTGVAGVASISDGTNAVDGSVQLLTGGGLSIVSEQGANPNITLTAAGVSTAFGSGLSATAVGGGPQELAITLESVDGSLVFQQSETDTFINMAVSNPTPIFADGLTLATGVLTAKGVSSVSGSGLTATAVSTTAPQQLSLNLVAEDETVILTPSGANTSINIKTNISAGSDIDQTGGNTFNAIDPNITANSTVVVCFTGSSESLALVDIEPSAGVAVVRTVGATPGTRMNYIAFNRPE